LSQEEARRRLNQYGPNELVKKSRIPPWKLFLEQFKNFLIILLLFAVTVSAVLGEVVDAILIGAIVFFAAGLGFIQEYRAERAVEALKQMAAPTASVLRDGKETEVPATDLVPGDVICISTGDRIPADARIIEEVNLKTDEASLTGESVPVEKMSDSMEGEISVGDRRNMVLMGTVAVYGRARAVITATGMSTEFGEIAGMLQDVKTEQTPLQINLDRMAKYIGIGALVICFMLAGFGIMRGLGVLDMLIWGIALAVAAVPEALPAVVVICLALGVRRMSKRNALMRRLSAAETLGSTTYICSDKTGTLTQDQMTLRRIYVDGRLISVTGAGYEPKGEFYIDNKAIEPVQDTALQILLNIGLLCNDTTLTPINGTWEIKGDPTEGALVVAATKAGLKQEELNSQLPRIDEIPFSSETKRMTTIHETPQGKVAYSKGALEVVLDSCRYIYTDGEEKQITAKDKEYVLSVTQNMAGDALRVLGIAYKRLETGTAVTPGIERDMVFVGLVGMIDPPREEVKDAIETCDQAGIKSVMITGDHKMTAVAIAKELGLFKGGLALTGAELDEIGQEEFEALVEKVEVYARVSPAHKLRVVEALAKKGHVVAMTGDGVNDAPALKRAGIGIAMGITGTDVTKEAADMVLTDDNFASIVAAIEEGRGIFNNIKKFLMYLISCNIGEILLMAVAVLFGPLLGLPDGALPLTAIQILFVNLVTDGLPAIALSVDPSAPNIMQQKPRPRGQGVFTVSVLRLMLVCGIWTFLLTLGVFIWAVNSGRSILEAQGLCFATLVIIELVAAYSFRSEKYSLFKVGFFTNPWLLLAILGSLITLILVVYIPILQEPFHTYSLGISDWLIVTGLSITLFPVLEVVKLIDRWRGRKEY